MPRDGKQLRDLSEFILILQLAFYTASYNYACCVCTLHISEGSSLKKLMLRFAANAIGGDHLKKSEIVLIYCRVQSSGITRHLAFFCHRSKLWQALHHAVWYFSNFPATCTTWILENLLASSHWKLIEAWGQKRKPCVGDRQGPVFISYKGCCVVLANSCFIG